MKPLSKEQILLLALSAIQFAHIIDFMIMMPLGPQLMRAFNIDPKSFSLLVSAYTISGAVASFLSAFFLDRFDRKGSLLVSFAGFVSGTLYCALADTYASLLIARLITGAFGGVLGALVLAIIGDQIPLERRGAAMGKVMSAFSVASVIGVPFGLYFASIYSWHFPFYALATIGIIFFPILYFNLPAMPVSKDGSAAGGHSAIDVLKRVFLLPNQRKALLFMIALMLGQFTVIPFISPYMVSNVGFEEVQLTYIYLLGGAFTFFTSPLVGKLADRYGLRPVFSISVLMSVVAMLVITNLGVTPLWLVLILSTFFFIVMGGRIIPANTLITASVRPENRGAFMSINSATQQMASGISAYIAGLIVSQDQNGLFVNYHWVGIFAAVASLICIVLAYRIKTVS